MPLADPRSARARTRDRMAFVGIASAAIVLLTVATWLAPDPHGGGSHRQLGLPACGFLALTGLPCPTCGSTTAFAHMVRGEIVAALSASPLGAVLCTLTWLSLPWSAWALARGLSLRAAVHRVRPERLALALAALGLAQWLSLAAAQLLP